jgi:hypothetical protein
MPDDKGAIDLALGLGSLRPKAKEPNSVRVLSSWIDHAEAAIGTEKSGRLAWLVASTVVVAALQQVVDDNDNSRFLLKGGTMLQLRLGASSRATKDIDGLIRGNMDEFLSCIRKTLEDDWGPISFDVGDVELINTPAKIIKPRRFEVSLKLRGTTWRKVVVEVSPDEGMAGFLFERFKPPSLAPLGLPTPDYLVSLAMSYQIAQKVHAATDLHDPPVFVNERARDVVDLVLLINMVKTVGSPSMRDIGDALRDIFESRAKEARILERPERTWPTGLTSLQHWDNDYRRAAESAGINLSLQEAVGLVNDWLGEIPGAHYSAE